jgi:transposase
VKEVKMPTKKFPPGIQVRAVRTVAEQTTDQESKWAAIFTIAGKIGCTAKSLRRWVRQGEKDQGKRPGLITDERERVKQLDRKVRELIRANEILRLASAFFAWAELDRKKT